MNRDLLSLGRAVALLVTSATLSWGQFVSPVSYSATPGGSGAYTYLDETGTQLTDSVLGVNDWSADLGNGNAYEWVGWTSPAPSITFTFSGSPTIQTVFIGFNRAEGGAAIYLPATVTINNANFSLAGIELPESTRGFLTFSGSWSGNTLQIDMTPAGPYTFVDEIRFSTVAVPESSTTALLFALASLICLLRRANRPR